MADTEKGDSSTGEAKAKKSMLDDDFSKDFLSSWKSMSTTGSDDMDFDFEPVSKGKKKTFDFGMDMDFSLDDAFGKMSSFKIDMPDFDFSTSPKKSTKPKEKSKEQDKHDDFLFSFDFDGGSTAEKTMLMKNKDPGHMNSKNPVTQATNDGERTEPSDSENNREGSTHIESVDKSCSSFSNSKENEKNSDDCPRSFNKEREKIEPDSVLEEMDKIPATHIDAVDNSGHHEKNSDENTNSCTKDSVLEKSETISVAAQITPRDQNNRNEMSADTVSHNGNEAKDGLPSLKNEKTINNAKSSRDMDFSLDDTFGKISSFKIDIPDVEFSSSPIKTIKPKEKPEEDSGEGNCQDKHDKFSYSLDFNGEATTSKTMLMTNKVLGARNSKFSGAQTKNDSGKTDFSASEDNREGLAHIGAVDKSAYGDGKHNGKNSNNAHPSSCSKELSKSDSVVEGNNEIAAACIDDVDRRQIEHIYEEKKSDENTSSCTKGLIKTDPVLEESEKIASVPIESVDMRYGDSRHTETNSDDSKISCTKDLIKPSPVLEKTEKISVAFTPSRDHDDTVHGKQRNEMSPDSLPHTGKEAMHGHGLSSLENKKMVNNVKSSGFRIPSVSPAEQRNKFGNQGQGKFNNKISGIASIQNLNIGQGDKVSAQRIDKKVLALPSLNFSRSSIKDKNLSAPTMQRNAKSPGNVEKNMNLQATIKMVSPVSAEKQTPSTPSLKRKLSEAADMIPAKLHTPKRVSTSESRMSKISAREVEHVAQTKGNLVERNSKNVSEEYKSPKFDFSHEANREALQFSMAAENDENVEKAEACSKELDNICNMLKKKHEEAKELLVRALVNNNNLLMLNHPIYEEKIRAVQRLASRLMSKELEVEA